MPGITRRIVLAGVLLALVAALFMERGSIAAWVATTRGTPAAEPTAAAAVPEPHDRAAVALDLRRQQLIGIRTAVATTGPIPGDVRMVGTVHAPETRLTDVNVKIDGWIRDLHADFTGQPVTAGEPLFSLYSPDLLAAEREFVLALKSRDDLHAAIVPDARQHAESLAAAARQRLQLLDVSASDLDALERTREPQSTITVHAPSSGFVVEKAAVAGMHVTAGQTLYRLVDLSVVWIEGDAYEHDVPLVHVGERARVSVDAFPAASWSARVTFIDPVLRAETRTASIRFEVANTGGRLKPGMYANVELQTSTTTGIVVPVDAVLDSGRQHTVFVDEGNGTFNPRAVQVGARGRDVVQITAGLSEGERVATSAAFFLDSESQLRSGLGAYAPPPGAATSAAAITITLRVQPDPPRVGGNAFEAIVKDASGQPVTNAGVQVQFFMPAMPTMNMPAMQNGATLRDGADGVYRGSAELMSAGRWEVTVTVTRGNARLGSLQTSMVAR